jgi:hypothetical protein
MYDPKDRETYESLIQAQKDREKEKRGRIVLIRKMKELLQRYEDGEDAFDILQELPYPYSRETDTGFEPGSDIHHDLVRVKLDSIFAPYRTGVEDDDIKSSDDYE